jgi:hypothetical protein
MPDDSSQWMMCKSVSVFTITAPAVTKVSSLLATAASEQDPVKHEPDHDGGHHQRENQLIPVEMVHSHTSFGDISFQFVLRGIGVDCVVSSLPPDIIFNAK